MRGATRCELRIRAPTSSPSANGLTTRNCCSETECGTPISPEGYRHRAALGWWPSSPPDAGGVPQDQFPSMPILEGADDDHDQIDEPPDEQPAEREQLQHASPHLADVETVNAEDAEEIAEDE